MRRLPPGYQDGVEGKSLDGWCLAGSQSKVWATLLGKTGPPGASTGCGAAGAGPVVKGDLSLGGRGEAMPLLRAQGGLALPEAFEDFTTPPQSFWCSSGPVDTAAARKGPWA